MCALEKDPWSLFKREIMKGMFSQCLHFYTGIYNKVKQLLNPPKINSFIVNKMPSVTKMIVQQNTVKDMQHF